MKKNTVRIAWFGVFTALALIFSYVETLIPFQIGIPGVKLGLANLIVVVALYKMGGKDAMLLSVTRIVLSGFIFASLFSILYSLAGGLLSLAVMVILKKRGSFSVFGVSMAGGVFHNVGQLKAYLKEQNVSHALINLGGNVLALGGKPDGSDYNIGIQKPFAQNGEAITSVKIKDQSVVSSGIYERYFKVDDKIYHHILDPKTGYPYENDLLGVSIVCDSSTEADALSTTCFAMGLDDGLKYIEGIKGAEALFITDDYEIHYSSGFQK